MGQLSSGGLSSKTEFSRQFSPHGASLGSGVDALTITDPHLCRFKSSSACRTDICLANALSRKLGPLLSEGALAERFLLVLLSIRIDCSRSWFSTLLEPRHLESTSLYSSSSPEDCLLSSLCPWIYQEPVVSRRSPGETVGTCRGTRRLCLHGDLFLLLCVGVELVF